VGSKKLSSLPVGTDINTRTGHTLVISPRAKSSPPICNNVPYSQSHQTSKGSRNALKNWSVKVLPNQTPGFKPMTRPRLSHFTNKGHKSLGACIHTRQATPALLKKLSADRKRLISQVHRKRLIPLCSPLMVFLSSEILFPSQRTKFPCKFTCNTECNV
jgi:hypothetical protein